MYSHPQRRSAEEVQELRREAGRRLRDLRDARGLSQRQLAEAVGAEHYTFVSQLETGRGRIPPDRYRVWAEALGVDVRDFVYMLMRYYDPVTHGILFKDAPANDDAKGPWLSRSGSADAAASTSPEG